MKGLIKKGLEDEIDTLTAEIILIDNEIEEVKDGLAKVEAGEEAEELKLYIKRLERDMLTSVVERRALEILVAVEKLKGKIE